MLLNASRDPLGFQKRRMLQAA